MDILKGRNIVWMFGMPIFFGLIWLGGYFFYGLIQVVIILMIKEYISLVNRLNTKPSLIILISASILIAQFYFSGSLGIFLNLEPFIFILIFILFIYELFKIEKNPFFNISMTIFGIFYIPFLLGTVIQLRQFDQIMYTNFTYALFISIWACDTAAFIFGSFFGKRKIFPNISPKKTWEGSVAGLVATILVFFIFFEMELLGKTGNLYQVIILGTVVSIFGQIGDLFESKLKREAEIKDSGTLLLGHGGVLDRFDSLIFASPVIYFYINFLI
ncbi:MAG: hypothetical protein CMG04_08290 [Candidatus Marinimicrobia bacterium]|nr:hypothetical protein [Candidatus Neomarinimicrobiota bacterium]